MFEFSRSYLNFAITGLALTIMECGLSLGIKKTYKHVLDSRSEVVFTP